MAVLFSEVELYNDTTGVSKEYFTNAGASVTLTTYGVGGSCDFEVSTDGGKTWFPRFTVNMKNLNTNSTLVDEGMFYTICGDVDAIRVSNVVGFTKVIASLG